MRAEQQRAILTALGGGAAVLVVVLVVVLLSDRGDVAVTSDGGDDDAGAPAVTTGSTDQPDDVVEPTTTTEALDDTTTTTRPTTTSTTTSTTTTSTTTTTTTPARPTLEFELIPSDAAFRETGSGDGASRLNGRTIDLNAITSGFDGEAVRTATLRWEIPSSEVAGLEGPYQVRARLEPEWFVWLQASRNSGRSAAFFVEFAASVRGRQLGTASDSRSVGADDEQSFGSVEVLGFGTTIEGEDIVELSARLDITCQATPGSTVLQVGESSECETDGFTVESGRIQLVPVDG